MLFAYDKQQQAVLDNASNLKPEQYDAQLQRVGLYRASNGRYVNTKALQRFGVDNINLPSRYIGAHDLSVQTLSALRSQGVDTDPRGEFAAMQQVFDKFGYDDIQGQKTKQLTQLMRTMHVQFGTGQRSYITRQQQENIRSLIESSIDQQTQSMLNKQTGYYEWKDNQGNQHKTRDLRSARAHAKSAVKPIKIADNAVMSWVLRSLH